MTDSLDDLSEAMVAAYRQYLCATMLKDQRVLVARTGVELQAAATACLLEADPPLDITVERDPDDPRRVNITVVPWPALTVAAVVRR